MSIITILGEQKEYADGTTFEEIAKDGKDILHLALSSGISGTYHSATIAAKEVSEKCGVKIIVIDSLCASLANGMAYP